MFRGHTALHVYQEQNGHATPCLFEVWTAYQPNCSRAVFWAPPSSAVNFSHALKPGRNHKAVVLFAFIARKQSLHWKTMLQHDHLCFWPICSDNASYCHRRGTAYNMIENKEAQYLSPAFNGIEMSCNNSFIVNSPNAFLHGQCTADVPPVHPCRRRACN